MFPDFITSFFHNHQEILWFCTVITDLAITLILYRLYGRQGLYTSVILGIVLSNLQGPKLTIIFGYETSMGVILYSGIYFATDILNERYGKKEANRAVMLGFACSIIMVLALSIGLLYLPSNQGTNRQFATDVHNAFIVLASFTPRFVFGSILAYLMSQRLDVWIYDALKKKTKGRFLWMRNNGSTMLAQLADTTIYALVAWWGIVELHTALLLGITKYVIKIVIAAMDTPFIYWAHKWKINQ